VGQLLLIAEVDLLQAGRVLMFGEVVVVTQVYSMRGESSYFSESR